MASSTRTETKKDEPAELTSAWQDHVNSVLRSRDLVIDQMKMNRLQVARLEREHKELAIRTGYILKEMQNAITIYSQLLCRPFCEQIHKKLPRELRNQIYGYLLGPRPAKPVPRISLIKQRRREIWFSESWVGRQFTVEICEMAYRTDNLQLCGSFNLADLLLLPEDNGVLPVAHMRSLVLKIDLQYRTCIRDCCYTGLPPPPPPFPHFQLVELSDSLQALHKIKRKPGFRLDIKISSGEVEPPLLKDTLDAMKPIILKLKEEGMKITIRYEFLSVPTNRYPDDLMAYYEQPSADWDELIKAHRDRLKADGVELMPRELVTPPMFPMNMPPPPLAPWQLPLPNPPMAAISVAHPIGQTVTLDDSDAGSEAGGSDGGASGAPADLHSGSNSDVEEYTEAVVIEEIENREIDVQPELGTISEAVEVLGEGEDYGATDDADQSTAERAADAEVVLSPETDTPHEPDAHNDATEEPGNQRNSDPGTLA